MKNILFILVISTLVSCSQLQPKPSLSDRHYVVVDVNISDVAKYNKFIDLEKPILKKHGAFISMDIRNKDQDKRYITISFPDRETVNAFVKSKEFQAILPLNKTSSKSKIFHGSLFNH